MSVKIPLSQQGKHKGKYVATVDDCDAHLAQRRWTADIQPHTVYAFRCETRGGKRMYIQMHREVLGVAPESEVDHFDGNGLNNRRENLRACTHAENSCNQKRHRNNSSGFSGVSWYPPYKKWRAYFKRVTIGYFNSAEEAAQARDQRAKEVAGDFAKSNHSPGDG